MNERIKNIYDKCMQSIKDAKLSAVEECIVANYIMDNWMHDSYRVKQTTAISEMYDFIFGNENSWPKFMKSIKACKIRVDDEEDIDLDISFLWKGEIYLFSYNPNNESSFDTFFIESDERYENEDDKNQELIFEKNKNILDDVAEKIDAVNAGDLFIYKVEHKDCQVACRKLLDELEKILD